MGAPSVQGAGSLGEVALGKLVDLDTVRQGPFPLGTWPGCAQKGAEHTRTSALQASAPSTAQFPAPYDVTEPFMTSAHAFARPGALAQTLHTQYLAVLLVLCWCCWCCAGGTGGTGTVLVVVVLCWCWCCCTGASGAVPVVLCWCCHCCWWWARPGGSCPYPAAPQGLAPLLAAGTRQRPPNPACLRSSVRGKAVRCPFLLGHEEHLAVPVQEEGTEAACVLRKHR